MYWTVQTTDGEALLRVDPLTASIAQVGLLDVPNVFGMAYAGGVLYGFTGDGEVIVIEPGSAEVLFREELPGQWTGAASAPASAE